MSKIHSFIEFLITVVLRSSANTRSVLNRFRVWRWLNEPMSESCAPIVRWWNAKAELANSDRNRYFMSARRRYGIFGYGLYTQYQPIILTDEYNTEIEELMKFRYKHESSFFMGGRFEVMAYIKGLRNSDFDNAITMDEFRAARFTAYIDAFCADTMNHQSLFRHWLSVQVRTGKLIEIDGYIFTGATKNCEIGAFLYKYFDTFETAHAVGLHQGYRSPEHLAQYLIKELQKAALGLTDNFEFECINTKLRDYTERNKASQIAVTDLGNTGNYELDAIMEDFSKRSECLTFDVLSNLSVAKEALLSISDDKLYRITVSAVGYTDRYMTLRIDKCLKELVDRLQHDLPRNISKIVFTDVSTCKSVYVFDLTELGHEEVISVFNCRSLSKLRDAVETNVVRSLSSTTYEDDFLQRMSNTTQSIASMPEAFRLHNSNVLKSSVSFDLDDIYSLNGYLFTEALFKDKVKFLILSENKQQLRFYNPIMPGLGITVTLKALPKFKDAVFMVVNIDDFEGDSINDADLLVMRESMNHNPNLNMRVQESPFIAIADALTDEVQQSNNTYINKFITDGNLVINEGELAAFKERNTNSEGDVYVLGGDRILETQNFQAITVLSYGDVDVINPKFTDLCEAGLICPSEHTLKFNKRGVTGHNYVILKVTGGAVWKHHSKSNAEVPSMCDSRTADIKVSSSDSDTQSLKDSTLNITFTTKSTIALDKPFDFTDVLGIFLNGDEVDISRKSTSIIDSLRVAGITFTDNYRYLHYNPANKHVDSIVLQLKKTSDVKTKAEFTVVAKQNIEVELTPEIRSMPGMPELIDSLSDSTSKSSNDYLEDECVRYEINANNSLYFNRSVDWAELSGEVLGLHRNKVFILSPTADMLRSEGLVLSDIGQCLSFVKTNHMRHDGITLCLAKDAGFVELSPVTEFIDVKSLARSVSAASGRLDVAQLSRP